MNKNLILMNILVVQKMYKKYFHPNDQVISDKIKLW